MQKIKVYSIEKADNLEEVIQSNASLAYVSRLNIVDNDTTKRSIAEDISLSVLQQKQEDLYYLDSVLVTTCWNKNDDVFAKEEVWEARTSPEDKPFNIEHDENKIIGHITGNWTIDSEGNTIPSDVPEDELPDTFHIVTSSVVYKHWTDPELIVRTQDMISKIEAGEKFVSMECLFTDFDYALKSKDGEMHTLSRSEESAFLTKHLRAYGGTGQYQDYQIGRLLRKINFCGHGLVDKPANPSSIIFDNYKPFNAPTEGTLAYFMSFEEQDKRSKEETNMSESIYKTQIEELTSSVKSLKTKNAELEDKLAQANVKEYEAKVEELSASVEAHAQELETAKSEAADVASKLMEAQSEIEKLGEELVKSNEAQAKMKSELNEIEEAKVRASRLLALNEAGMDEEQAEAALEKFGELTQEQFEAIAEQLLLVNTKNGEEVVDEEISEASSEETEEPADEPAEEEDVTEDEAEASADESVLEDAEASEEVALSASSEEGLEDTRSALSGLIANKFLNSVKE